MISSKDATLPSTKPALIAIPASSPLSSINLANTFAGATTSSACVAKAVVPLRASEISSKPTSLIANLVRVFLTTVYSTPASRSFVRSSVSFSTVRPL